MMSSETFSILVWCWRDSQTNTTQLRLVHVDTAEEVRLKEGNFLLRISRDDGSSIERCLIRHLASGQEAFVQSGPQLRAFVKACLLDGSPPTSTDPGSTGE
jgi:hypothetical protein